MRTMLARIALTLSLLVPVWFMAAALGAKFGLWSWRVGLGVMIVSTNQGIISDRAARKANVGGELICEVS